MIHLNYRFEIIKEHSGLVFNLNPIFILQGGIVRPVNDVVINKGYIEKIKLGEKTLVRFQIVEYLRAFLFGRF